MVEFLELLKSRLATDAIREIELASQALVFERGEPSSAFYHVLQGQVTLRRGLENGDYVVIHSVHKGEFFAEASLFSETYHCDAVAISDSLICAISRDQFLDAVRIDPELSLAFATNLAQNVRDYRQILEIRSIKSAKMRVYASFELGLFRVPINDFSAQIGLTHEACYRALKDLVDDGVLTRVSRGHYALA